MKKIFLICLMTLVLAPVVSARKTEKKARASRDSVRIEQVKVTCSGDRLLVTLQLDASLLKVRQNEEVSFTPIVQGRDTSAQLPAIHFTGRNRHFLYLRNDEEHTRQPYYFRAPKQDVVSYQAVVPYEPWMERLDLLLDDSRCGCRKKILGQHQRMLGAKDFRRSAFVPDFLYIAPEIQDKIRQASGTAYIDFPINRTEILENFRNNAAELFKITSTIDSVKLNPDATIIDLHIKGYASPDGSYAGNDRLAKDRTAALMAHVRHLYAFPEELLHTDYEAEDWKGMREQIAISGLEHREDILQLIDNEDMEPDYKERLIREGYPEEYRFIKAYVYPALRRSDYTVSYSIRSYVDLEEAKEVMESRPGNLSPSEFYRIAETYPQGSEAYNEVFLTMARVYPQDETANLNAANVSMSLGELKSAGVYLEKAGLGPEVDYARGILEALKEQYERAGFYFQRALKGGISRAEAAIEQLEGLKNNL